MLALQEIKPDDATETKSDEQPAVKDWTVMFLFASDNELAPLIISQLKAIKDAHSHPKVNVIVQFDPCAGGVATKLLHVNRNVGQTYGAVESSAVTNMDDDTIRWEEIKKERGEASKRMRTALQHSDTIPALEALQNFLGYCRENFPANNYALFLVGHGLVVGNDAFLPDQHPVSAVTLSALGEVLKEFSEKARIPGESPDKTGTLQLLALHSCAMSAVEVAYELKGTARYMLASEGISYVGSYPYRNMLVKLFDTIKEVDEKNRKVEPKKPEAKVDVEELVEKLYSHSLHNATDFILTGYSLDLALCSLEKEKYDPLTEKLSQLVALLKEAVLIEPGRELILLAHWEAQSYWDENYTDLYDFCFCLERKCRALADILDRGGVPDNEVEYLRALGARDGAVSNSLVTMLDRSAKLGGEAQKLRALAAACDAVKLVLSPNKSTSRKERFKKIVVHADNFGTKYQYSHGLSVYFPWSKPLVDEPPPPAPVAPRVRQRKPKPTDADFAAPVSRVLSNYAKYKFSDPNEFGEHTWLSFLNVYFTATQRKSRREEDVPDWEEDVSGHRGVCLETERASKSLVFHAGALAKETGAYAKETGAYGDCSCPSIKNYPIGSVVFIEKNKQGNTEEVVVKEVEVKDFACTRGVLTRIE
jgi:hypothetical protein